MRTNDTVTENKMIMQDVNNFIQSIMNQYYVSEDESSRLIRELLQLQDR